MDVRKNVYSLSRTEWQRFVTALNALKASGAYDQFVRRHNDAMMAPTLLPGETGGSFTRNVAHRGPAFLPWHRQELRELELALQAQAAGVTLPYWDWAADAALADPRRAPLFTSAYAGSDGNPANGDRVPDGPFRTWRALIYNAATNTLVPRSTTGLIRRLGRDPQGLPTLPTQTNVTSAMSAEGRYDSSRWDRSANPSFRSRLEGWLLKPALGDPSATGLHNRVHTWVGGDMLPGTSPNDPVFFLHHCNIDRLWAAWQASHPTTGYAPVAGGPPGHNLNDRMRFLGSTTVTPASTLDHQALGYRYDTEPAAVAMAATGT